MKIGGERNVPKNVIRPLLTRNISRPRMCLLTRSTLHHEVHTTFAYELGLTELWGRLHFKPTAVRISTAGRSLLSLCDYSPGRASGVAKSNRFYQTPMTSFLPVSSLFRMMNKVYIKQLLNKSINKKSPMMELFIFSRNYLSFASATFVLCLRGTAVFSNVPPAAVIAA